LPRTRIVAALVWPLAVVLLCLIAPNALAAPSGAISGKVTDASTHKPIEGIEVCAYSLTASTEEQESAGNYGCTETGSSGEYTISPLSAGNFGVVFGSPIAALEESSGSTLNYVDQYYKDTYPPAAPNPVSVSSGTTTAHIDAELEEGAEISGTITNVSTGAGVEGAIACAVRPASQEGIEAVACARSGASGDYVLAGIPDGSFEVAFLGTAFVSQYYPGKASFSEAGSVVIAAGKEIKTGIDAALQPQTAMSTSGIKGSSTATLPTGQLPGMVSPVGPSASTLAVAVSLSGSRLQERQGQVLVKLRCGASTSCHGKLVLKAKRTVKRKGRTVTQTLTIGSAYYTLRPGTSSVVMVRLSLIGRHLLHSGHGRLAARLSVSQTAPAPVRSEIRSVVLVTQKAVRKR
jgi:hypothetical protein